MQDDPSQTECRFIVKMICNQGVTKTYKLTYEAVDVMHALFDRNVAKNRWSMHSSAMKEYIEYFGTKTEMLEICAGDDGRVVFKSYTEKVMNGKEVLKQPLVTAVAVNTSDFETFNVQPDLQIVISVKDFKAIVTHADTLKTSLKAYYSQPSRPLQFNYGSGGLTCEFTLMTSGDPGAVPPAPTTAVSSRASSRAQSTTTEREGSRSTRIEMPAPPERASIASLRSTRRTRQPGSRQGPSPKPSEAESDSLFVTQNDDQWDPKDFDEEQEILEWDASGGNTGTVYPTFRDSGSLEKADVEDNNNIIPPTQRVSQVKGLW